MRKILPSYRWLFLFSALLFAQVSLATHDHHETSLSSHDCVVCQAQSALDHAHSPLPTTLTPLLETPRYSCSSPADLFSSEIFSQPARGPPTSLRI